MELFNGRSQMVVSSLYYSNLDPYSVKSADTFFTDYKKKKVPGDRIVEKLTMSLEVAVEDGGMDAALMERVAQTIVDKIQKHFPKAKIPKDFHRWRKYLK